MKLAKINPFWFFIFFCLGAYMIWFYLKRDNRKLVLENYEISVGKIDEYRVVGTIKSYKITYSYYVDGKRYKTKSSALSKFKGCEYNFSLCSDKEFWVAYEKDNPSNSLINLDIEIQGIENPVPPETLEGFR